MDRSSNHERVRIILVGILFKFILVVNRLYNVLQTVAWSMGFFFVTDM